MFSSSETGVSGKFGGRIKGAKYRFAHVAGLEFPRETSLILRRAGKVGNPFWSQTGAVQAPPPPLPALPLQKVTQTVGMLREHPWMKARRSMDEGASLPSRAPL